MPALGAVFPIRKLLEAIEQMAPDMLTMQFDVSVTMPYYLKPSEDDCQVEVQLRFVVPMDVAERHGFSERRGLPTPQAAVAPGEGSGS